VKPFHFTETPVLEPIYISGVLEGSLYCKETCFQAFRNFGAVQEIGMESAQIVVSGLPEGATESQLMIYFQSERESGGGDVESIEIDGGRAFVTFEDVEGT
jgi:hypothetical protein